MFGVKIINMKNQDKIYQLVKELEYDFRVLEWHQKVHYEPGEDFTREMIK